MKRLAQEYPLVELCRVLGLSRSGYYKWLGHRPSPRALANNLLSARISRIHQESRKAYGSPRITQQLRAEGLVVGKNRVARLMKNSQLRARPKRPFRPRTTDSRHAQTPVAPNRLKQLPAPAQSNQIWVSDITYIWTASGWLYLAAVMDLFSRRIVGWSLGQRLEASLVKQALNQALAARRPAPGLVHHSDRGVQYTSSAFRALLHSWKIEPSMSGLGHCYDNAAMESFWSSLKNELVHHEHFEGAQQARLAIFDYIERFYNRKRLHSALGYKSPVDFENQISYKNN